MSLLEVFLDLYENVFKDKYFKDKATKTFGILFTYAKDDIEKELFTADEFGRAVQMSGKYYKFVPTYPELKESIFLLRDEDRHKPKPYNENQIEDSKPATKEESMIYINRIKHMVNKVGKSF